MKKIFNRVLAAAIAVPMTLTQGVVLGVSAEGSSAKALTLDTLVAIPADKTESEWNAKVLAVISDLNGTEKEIAKDDFIALLPANNSYADTFKSILAVSEVPNPVLSVKNGVVTVTGTANISGYAAKLYATINNELKKNGFNPISTDAFDKTVSYEVSFDGNALLDGKEVDFNINVEDSDGFVFTAENSYDYIQGQIDAVRQAVLAEVGEYADEDFAADLDHVLYIDLAEKLKSALEQAATISAENKTASYATADEMMAAISKYVASKTEFTVPSTVDGVVADYGDSFAKGIAIINDMTASNGYTVDISAQDIADLLNSGSDFEVSAASGTYTVTFQIPDDEADEVKAYVDAQEEANGKAYDSSYKTVEARVTDAGVAYLNVTRTIILKDAEVTTTTTTTSSTTTTSEESTTTTTSTTTATETTTTSTTTGTETVPSTGTGSETTIPEGFALESVKAEATEGYYFSHDENAFDLTELFQSLVLVGSLTDAEGNVTSDYEIEIAPADYAKYLTPAYETPAAYYEAVGEAYVADELDVTFTAPADVEKAELYDATLSALPTVYIAIKGDADLNGEVDIPDASLVLAYYSRIGANTLASMNDDPALNKLAYFVADIDTESKAGQDGDGWEMNISDASMILRYYSLVGAGLEADWSNIVAG
jgi:hypothetical protein